MGMKALDILLTPRGIIYAGFTLLLIIHAFISLPFFLFIAGAFLVLRLLQAWSEQFGCFKCWVGLGSAVFMSISVFVGMTFQLFMLTVITMWADAWLHNL